MQLQELRQTEDYILSQSINEMANLNPTKTGLPVVICIGEVGGQHGPRVKVSNVKGKFRSDDCFVMTVSREPDVMTPRSVRLSADEVEDVADWIKLNYDTLMELYQAFETAEGDTVEIMTRLQSL